MGHCCNVKCSLCSAQQVWWSLNWVLQQGWAGGMGGLWFCHILKFSLVVETVLSNHCAQSPVSVCVASPGHFMGHCKVKCSLCSAQKVWWILHWVLRQGCAGGL